LPGFLSKIPPILVGVTPPTLADVLTIKMMASEFMPIPEGTLDKLDKDLAAVPVSHEAAVTRCARYDPRPPVARMTLHSLRSWYFLRATALRMFLLWMVRLRH
jgi:hypothetical protein